MDDHSGSAFERPARVDPRARARADVRAILSRALGLRRIVELAAEIRVDLERAEDRTSRRQIG